MIVYEGQGDLFACQSQTITCPINIVGAMGKGLALEFRDRVPGLYAFYQQNYPKSFGHYNAAKENYLQTFRVPDGRQVLLFPTKGHWRYNSDPVMIRRNLEKLAEKYSTLYQIQSLALPALGCGCGKLNYERDLRPMIHAILGPLPLKVEVLFK